MASPSRPGKCWQWPGRRWRGQGTSDLDLACALDHLWWAGQGAFPTLTPRGKGCLLTQQYITCSHNLGRSPAGCGTAHPWWAPRHPCQEGVLCEKRAHRSETCTCSLSGHFIVDGWTAPSFVFYSFQLQCKEFKSWQRRIGSTFIIMIWFLCRDCPTIPNQEWVKVWRCIWSVRRVFPWPLGKSISWSSMVFIF